MWLGSDQAKQDWLHEIQTGLSWAAGAWAAWHGMALTCMDCLLPLCCLTARSLYRACVSGFCKVWGSLLTLTYIMESRNSRTECSVRACWELKWSCSQGSTTDFNTYLLWIFVVIISKVPYQDSFSRAANVSRWWSMTTVRYSIIMVTSKGMGCSRRP